MKNIFTIFWTDVKRIHTNVVAIVVIIGLTILPSLYAWFNILSNWDPYGEAATSNIKVAVASNDQGTSMEGIEIKISDTIIESLKANQTIGWEFPETADEAIAGVYSGEYYAALILPEDFSADMVSFLSDTMTHPEILYYVNEKKNAIAPKITDKAKNAVKEQVNSTVISSIAGTVVEAADTIMDSDTMKELGVNEDTTLLDVIIAKLDDIRMELNTYTTLLDSIISITDSATGVVSSTQEVSSDLDATLANEQKQLKKLQENLDSGLLSLTDISDSLSDNLDSIQKVMKKISATYTKVDGNMSEFQNAISKSRNTLIETKGLIVDLQNRLSDTITSLEGIREGEGYDMLLSLLDSNTEELGGFLASPISIETQSVYQIDGYGSAMAPFYTVLALWVGALILVAIIHTHPEPDKKIKNVKWYQAFFGRYLTFFIISQMQALLCVLGNLYYIRIQCLSPLMFWLASAVTSFVFSLLMYSLTFAFGNVGEAIAVVIMVIQVAGTGGTFPKEVLPEIYQKLYDFMPFPYAMDALRETVGGFYQNDYWHYLICLLSFALVALFIGLIVSIPCEKLNHMVEKSKEKSGIML